MVDTVIPSPLAGKYEESLCQEGWPRCTKRARYLTQGLVRFAVETGRHLGSVARAIILRLAEAAADLTAQRLYMYRAVSSIKQDGVARHLESRI